MSARLSEYPLCRHTKTDGRLCQSPALATSAFCHFHQRAHRTRMTTIGPGPALSTHVLHPLRDAKSIRQAIAMVLSATASGRLQLKKAKLMLYALQLATSELRRTSME
jgi:hypothetical protein